MNHREDRRILPSIFEIIRIKGILMNRNQIQKYTCTRSWSKFHGEISFYSTLRKIVYNLLNVFHVSTRSR